MIRWTLREGPWGGPYVDTYTVPLNPKEMGPLGRVYTRETLPAGGNRAQVRVRESGSRAYEWSFSGRIYKQAHYDDLLRWTNKRVPIILGDHLGRFYQVVLTNFEPKDLRRPGTTVRWDYTVKAIVLEGPL